MELEIYTRLDGVSNFSKHLKIDLLTDFQLTLNL